MGPTHASSVLVFLQFLCVIAKNSMCGVRREHVMNQDGLWGCQYTKARSSWRNLAEQTDLACVNILHICRRLSI